MQPRLSSICSAAYSVQPTLCSLFCADYCVQLGLYCLHFPAYVVNSTINITEFFLKNGLINFIYMKKYWIFFLNYNYIFCTIHYSKHYLFFNLCSLECVSYAAACWQHAVSYTEQALQLTLCSLDCSLGCMVYIVLPML